MSSTKKYSLIVDEIVLAEVPFSNNYSDVWDVKNPDDVFTILNSDLIEHYRLKVYNNGVIIGFNTNKDTTITLDTDLIGVPYTIFSQYNYCAIKLKPYSEISTAQPITYSPSTVLYFIKDVEFNNSSLTATLHLEWDKWLNNAGLFFENNTNSFKATRSTKNMWNYDSDSDNWVFNLEYFSDTVKKPQTLYKTYDKYETSKLLWCCYCCANDENTYIGTKYNSSPFYTGMLEVYIPLCSIENIFVTSAVVKDVNNKECRTLINNVNLSNLAIATLETITQYKFLTTSPPFKCKFNINDNVYYCDTDFVNTIFINGVQNEIPQYMCIAVNKKKDTPYEKTLDIATDKYNVVMGKMSAIKTLNEPNTTYQHLSNIYPYFYTSVIFGNNTVDFIPQVGAKNFTFSVYQISQYIYMMYGTDNSKEAYIHIPHQNYSSFPLFKDPSVWNVLYKTSEDNVTAYNSLSKIMSSSNTSVGGIINTVTGIASDYIKLDEKRRRRDEEITTLSGGISCASLYDETPIIVKNAISNEEHTVIANEMERYGIECNVDVLINSQYNHKFDYFVIPISFFKNLDNYCKPTIESMFKSGVRIWHAQNLIDIGLIDDKTYTTPTIPYANQSKAVKEIINMSYDRANVPMSIIKGENINLLSKDND